jgi:hypothetical protein
MLSASVAPMGFDRRSTMGSLASLTLSPQEITDTLLRVSPGLNCLSGVPSRADAHRVLPQ